MNSQTKRRLNKTGFAPVRFSIGARLILIISAIVLVSLLSITYLVSWLVSEDLRISAEENNFEVNRRSAMEAESSLGSLRSNSIMLIQTINALAKDSTHAVQALELFFQENPLAAFLFYVAGGKLDDLLINERFFLSRDVDKALANAFIENNREPLRRAASGETMILNVTPFFGTPLLALIYPWYGGALGVIFSPEKLNDSFGSGTNQSYLINDSGDILVHADVELLRSAANIAGQNFTKEVRDNKQRNAQLLYTDENGIRYFGAFTKLNIGGAVVITSIEYDKVFEGIAATTRRNLYLTVTVLSISIMLIWFFSKSISNPLKKLAAAAVDIEKGVFEQHLVPKGRSEIGVLTASFQRMSNALAIFGRFTNREIAVKAMKGEIKPGGMSKQASILFSDIRDFTEMSEKFTNNFGDDASNRLIHWLNDYFTRMVECVEKTGGVVDKFAGDGMMAHWGAAHTTGSTQEDAINCVKAALLMRKVLYTMNSSRSKTDPDNPPIKIGCGINTGTVTAGQIGSELRMNYTVIGDPVNLASRTEAMNKSLATDILITENTWNLVKDHFVTQEMREVEIKGIKNPVRLYAVINVVGSKTGPHSLEDIRKLFNITMPTYKRRLSDQSPAAATADAAANEPSRESAAAPANAAYRTPAGTAYDAPAVELPSASASAAAPIAAAAADKKIALEMEGTFITPKRRNVRKQK